MDQHPKLFSDLSSDQQKNVRVWIAGRIKTLLAHFWRPDDPQPIEEAVISDWVEALVGYRTQDIQDACIAYLKAPDTAKSGAAIRPGPHHVIRLIERENARKRLISEQSYLSKFVVPEPPPPLTDEERREERRLRDAKAAWAVETARAAGFRMNVRTEETP